ncbi:zinc ribbon domain-containing protein [Lysinibacillus sp. CTST325]
MICRHCNEQHPKYFTYCPKTDGIIEQEPLKYTYATNDFCLSCGTKNEESGSFCSQCGSLTINKVEQKATLNKVISNTLKNVNVPNMGNMKGQELKTLSKEKVNFFKNNPLFFVPIVVSILLLFLFTFFVKSSILDVATVDQGREESAIIKAIIDDPSEFEDMIYKEFGVRLSIPKVLSLPRLVTVLHNVKAEGHVMLGAVYDQNSLDISMDNVLFGLLFIPFIALAIGGVLYGILARKHNWPLYQGIVYSTIVYVIVMSVVSIMSNFSTRIGEVETKGLFMIDVSLNYSTLDMILSATILSIVIFGFTAILTYFNKSIFEKLSYQVKYVQYAMFSVAITCIGLLINFLNVYFSLGKKVFESELPEGLVGTVSIFSSIYMGTWNWICTFFSKQQMRISTDGLTESITYSIFGNEKSEIYNSYFYSLFEEGNYSLLPSFILVLVTIVLISAAGYILYIVHRMNWKECLIFAGIFTALQMMLIYFVNIQLDFVATTDKTVQFSFAFEMIATVLLVFIVSSASFAAGGFLRQYQLKK